MKSINDIDFMDYVEDNTSAFVKYASEFLEEAKARNRGHHQDLGDPMPWQKTHDKIRFRPKEVTLWAGYNNSGKSLVVMQCMAWLMTKTPIVVASMEMSGGSTLDRVLRQTSGVENWSDAFADKFNLMTDMNFYVYDQEGEMNQQSVLGMIRYCAEQLGVKHVVIDSLMKCIPGTDNYNAEKDFMNALTWAAKRYNIHVHLVVHMRKPSDHDFSIPTRFSIKGSSAISDLCDNAIIVDLNRKKLHLEETGKMTDEESIKPDCYLKIDKQRHGEFTGTMGFWWHPASQQWIPGYNKGALPWPGVNFS